MTWLPLVQSRWPVRLLPLAVWGLAVVVGMILIVRALGHGEVTLGVFPTYYTAAKLIANGESVANFYDDAWFISQVTLYVPGVTEIHNANPPFLGFFFLPLIPLSYDDARNLMRVIGFVALIAATYLTTTELRITGVWRAAGFVAVFAAIPSLDNTIYGQVYTVVLLMLVLAWRAWRKGAEEIGGSLIGIVLCFKTAGLFLWPLMVVERRWRALAAAIATVAVLFLITAPFIGTGGWVAYFGYATGLVGAPHIAVPTRMSIQGLVRNSFRYDAQYNPDPYFDAPILGLSLEVLIFLTIAALAARVAIITRDRDVAYALFIVVSLVLVPVTNINHICLAYLPAFVIFSRIRDRLLSPLGAWFLVSGVLSFAPSVPRIHGLAAWGGPIFLYPRLAGLIGLMALLVVLGLRSKKAPAARLLPSTA